MAFNIRLDKDFFNIPASVIVHKRGDVAVAVDGYTKHKIAENTDHASVIQKAIDHAVESGGKVVYLSRGTYILNKPISINKDNIRVVGEAELTNPTPSGTEWNHQGLLKIDADNVVVEGLKFNVVGRNDASDPAAIGIYGGDNIKIRNCRFTLTNNRSFLAVIGLDGQYGSRSMTNIKIESNVFHDNSPNIRVLHIYPRDGHTVEGLWIVGNLFKNNYGIQIHLDAYDILRDVYILGNRFIDIYGSVSANLFGAAVQGGLARAYQIYNVIIKHNIYYTTKEERNVFAQLYQMEHVEIEGNIAIAKTSNPVQAIALGRGDYPIKHVVIKNNYFEGFDAFWDADSMVDVEVEGNIGVNLGEGLVLGYDIQEYVRIRNNLFYNCAWRDTLAAQSAIFLANSNPVKSVIEGNVVVNDTDTPKTKYAITLTGHYDFHDVIVRNNRIYVPKGTLEFIHYQYGDEVPPSIIEMVEVHDSTGIKRTENRGTTTITGDGSTTTFTVDVDHRLVSDKVSVKVGCKKEASYKWWLVDADADDFYEKIRIQITFATAPANGETVEIYWSAQIVA